MYRCVLKYYNQYRISVGEEELPYEIVDIDKQNEIETQQKKERKRQIMEKHGRKIIILVSVVAILISMYVIWNVIQNLEKYEADKMIPVMLVCCLIAALCFLLIGLLYNKGAEIRNILIAVMLLGVTIVLLVFDTVGRLGQEGTPIITDTMEYVLVWAVVLGCVIYIIRSSITRKKT
jgi:magnesium-transporting ATPase (P-type)